MYTNVQSFVQHYQQEAATTQKLLEALTDASLQQEIAPGFRTLGFLAWHLATSGGMLAHAGLQVELTKEQGASASEIGNAYKAAAASIIQSVQSNWTDAKLGEPLELFGQQWTYGSLLHMFVNHEIHHRGQLTVLMRQAGLPVAGVYGPSKEEWIARGMQAPQ